MTRTLCKGLVELAARGKADSDNKGVVIAQLVEALENYYEHFTPVMLVRTREFHDVLATLHQFLSSDSTAPTGEPISQELESSLKNFKQPSKVTNTLLYNQLYEYIFD